MSQCPMRMSLDGFPSVRQQPPMWARMMMMIAHISSPQTLTECSHGQV